MVFHHVNVRDKPSCGSTFLSEVSGLVCNARLARQFPSGRIPSLRVKIAMHVASRGLAIRHSIDWTQRGRAWMVPLEPVATQPSQVCTSITQFMLPCFNVEETKWGLKIQQTLGEHKNKSGISIILFLHLNLR